MGVGVQTTRVVTIQNAWHVISIHYNLQIEHLKFLLLEVTKKQQQNISIWDPKITGKERFGNLQMKGEKEEIMALSSGEGQRVFMCLCI